MAYRPSWQGHLKLSLVSCPVALYAATNPGGDVHFNLINPKTNNRIRMVTTDPDTGPVDRADLVKGYEVAKGEYVEVTDEELESVALESTKTIEIDEFVPRDEIDELYNIRPYYMAPDGKVGQDAFVVIRNVIEQMEMVAIGRVVLTSREHVIAITPRGKGLMGTLLRFPYEVRDPAEYFDDIPNVKLTKDMMELARHIAKASLSCLAIGKQAFYTQVNLPDPAAYDLASNVIASNFFTEDGREGVAAFLEKRKPVWKDR